MKCMARRTGEAKRNLSQKGRATMEPCPRLNRPFQAVIGPDHEVLHPLRESAQLRIVGSNSNLR